MITVNKLDFTYPRASRQTLNDINFEIAQGEIFGFLGPSGAGKTTTQKILIGLLAGWSGDISVMGRPLGEWGYEYYQNIGVSFEFPNHYLKLTALENLRYFAALHSEQTRLPEELLELVGLGDDGDLYVAEFSKGMKNRLTVARALLHDPDILFLDEPTAGLDPVNARRIKDLIVSLKAQGKTIFLSTHDMAVAEEVTDRVAFIVDGAVRVVDSPRNLKLIHGRRVVRLEFEQNGQRESAEFPLDGLGDDVDFQTALRRSGLQTIHSQEPTLESIFIDVTGRELS